MELVLLELQDQESLMELDQDLELPTELVQDQVLPTEPAQLELEQLALLELLEPLEHTEADYPAVQAATELPMELAVETSEAQAELDILESLETLQAALAELPA